MTTRTHYGALTAVTLLVLAVSLAAPPRASAQGADSAGRTHPAPPTPRRAEEQAEAADAAARPPAAHLPAQPAPPAAGATAPEPQTQAADERLTFLDENRGGAVAGSEAAPSAMGLLTRTLGALCLVVGLIFAASWCLRRFGGARFGQTNAGAPALSVLSSVSLGDKRSLAIVRFGGRTLLVGSTAQAITLLAEDGDEHAAEESSAPPARSVADLLADGEAVAFERELVMAGARLNQVGAAPHESAGAA